MSGPDLPMRFPCWVQAIYSWGGETKKDLGFVEGDLIECLNAGDGSWWVGRLKRDRRMVGAFPSNFVKVLGDDFQPKPRKASPLPPGASVSHVHGRPLSAAAAPVKSRNSYLRKAFASYATASSPNPSAAARELEEKNKSASPTPPGSFKKNSRPRPYSSMHKPMAEASRALTADTFRPPSPPKIPQPIARATHHQQHQQQRSHQQRHSQDFERASACASPSPYSRATSPRPPLHAPPDTYRSSSPNPYPASDSGYYTSQGNSQTAHEDSPPPLPPAHRVTYTRQTTPERHSPRTSYSHDRPSPAGSGHSGMTPSPLRDAMNDVMSSLDDMGTASSHDQQQQEHAPADPWSPEAFGEVYSTPSRRPRPHTAMELRQSQYADDNEPLDDSESGPYNPYAQDSQAQVQSYVQRMESRLRHMQVADDAHDGDETAEHREYFSPDEIGSSPPPVPLKFSQQPRGQDGAPQGRPQSSYMPRATSPTTAAAATTTNTSQTFTRNASIRRSLKHRKSAFELGKDKLNRTLTKGSSTSSAVHSTSTNNSHGTQSTNHTLMSGYSAGGFSATSAGSFARRALSRRDSTRSVRPNTAMELHRPGTAISGYSYHDSHASGPSSHQRTGSEVAPSGGLLGGLSEPTESSPKKRGFFKKLGDKVKTSTATARSTVSRPSSPTKGRLPDGISSMAGGLKLTGKDAAREMGLGGGSGSASTVDWVQMRRDVNRSNSLSRNERSERLERSQMMDYPVLAPVEDLHNMTEGSQAADGNPVEQSSDFQALTYTMVDKSARFVPNLPATLNAASLAQGYICRPHRSDLQKLRAIFTWVSERIAWEEEFEGDVDARRVIQSRRGSAKEVALLVAEMCSGVGIHAEMVRGYLKSPNESLLCEDLNDIAARPNHWWNAVVVENEWRIIDCSLATPSNPKRIFYSSASNSIAESWWFLAKPIDICYTHVPLLPEQQHLVPPVPHEVLMALPLACPPFFKNKAQMFDFDTSLLYLDGLEMGHIQMVVPEDVECVAEVEARSYAQDQDGDRFESGEIVTKRALAQAEFVTPVGSGPAEAPLKRYTIKAVLPSLPNAAAQATLKVYAGKRGLMHGIHNNPHSLAMTLHLAHEGTNPDYDFFLRHPTPHALRNELYVTGPQCYRLACNNTFVFGVRQHPATSSKTANMLAHSRPASPNPLTRPTSALSIARPGSAMSMTSTSASGSAYSNPSNSSADSGSSSGSDKAHKPAKLAIQSPGGKILRMNRKVDHAGRDAGEAEWKSAGSSWETIIKIGEKGTWRGLVLADRTARWCVFAEWECV